MLWIPAGDEDPQDPEGPLEDDSEEQQYLQAMEILVRLAALNGLQQAMVPADLLNQNT